MIETTTYSKFSKKKYIVISKTENILNVAVSLNDNCVTMFYYNQYIISLLRHEQACLMKPQFER